MTDAPGDGLFDMAALFVLDRFVSGRRPSPGLVADELRRYHAQAMCSEEVLVCSLIYLERATSHPDGCSLSAQTWRPMLLMSTMLASKTWDDLSMTNGDFALIASVTLQEVNSWERDFLINGLRWDTSVSAGRYFSCFTSLRDELLKASGTPTEVLTRKRLRTSTSEPMALPPLRRSKSLQHGSRGPAQVAGSPSSSPSAPAMTVAWADPAAAVTAASADALMALAGTEVEDVVRV